MPQQALHRLRCCCYRGSCCCDRGKVLLLSWRVLLLAYHCITQFCYSGGRCCCHLVLLLSCHLVLLLLWWVLLLTISVVLSIQLNALIYESLNTINLNDIILFYTIQQQGVPKKFLSSVNQSEEPTIFWDTLQIFKHVTKNSQIDEIKIFQQPTPSYPLTAQFICLHCSSLHYTALHSTARVYSCPCPSPEQMMSQIAVSVGCPVQYGQNYFSLFLSRQQDYLKPLNTVLFCDYL